MLRGESLRERGKRRECLFGQHTRPSRSGRGKEWISAPTSISPDWHWSVARSAAGCTGRAVGVPPKASVACYEWRPLCVPLFVPISLSLLSLYLPLTSFVPSYPLPHSLFLSSLLYSPFLSSLLFTFSPSFPPFLFLTLFSISPSILSYPYLYSPPSFPPTPSLTPSSFLPSLPSPTPSPSPSLPPASSPAPPALRSHYWPWRFADSRGLLGNCNESRATCKERTSHLPPR